MGSARKILMRIVFFGTPAPAAEILSALIAAGQEIVCVVTRPDRPRGRGQKVSFSPVKEAALRLALPLEQPEETKNNNTFKSLLTSFKPDIAVVVAYGKILPEAILAIPRYGFINVHASLLPKYRGAAPIQWALLKGEKETGVTIFKIVGALDAGPILKQKAVKIGEQDDYSVLSNKLFDAGKQLLLAALPEIEAGMLAAKPQDESKVTFAPSLSRESGEIDWRKPADDIFNRIRALAVWPTAHTFWRGKRLSIFKAQKIAGPGSDPGKIAEIFKNKGFSVGTGAGSLLIEEVQMEGGKKMKAYEFVIGHDVRAGETLPS
jgi:methionyl-tRNA formyltransferase